MQLCFKLKFKKESELASSYRSSLAERDESLPAAGSGERRLRLLTYNIQTGIATSRYRHYLTHSWKHVLPCAGRRDNLDRIASLVRHYDIVGLQEAEAGSRRAAT